MSHLISKLGFIGLIIIGFYSCKDQTKTDHTSETAIEHNAPKADMHTSEMALDWHGTYKGLLPCADCEGITTELVLNKDYTFTLKSTYLGKDNTVFETKGTFKWNSEGSEITTTSANNHLQSYKVGENKLWHLDSDGNVITGNLAAHYTLTKSNP